MCPESHLVKGSYNSYLCPWDSITSSNQTSGLWQREKGEKRTLQPCWLRGRLQFEENCSFFLEPAWDLGNAWTPNMTWSTKHAMSARWNSDNPRTCICIWENAFYSEWMCVSALIPHIHPHARERIKMSLVMVFFQLLWLWHLKIFGKARAVCPGVAQRTVKPATALFSILIANLIARDEIRCGV